MLFMKHPAFHDNLEMRRVIGRCLESCDAKSHSYSHRCFQRLEEKLDPTAGILQGWKKDEQQKHDDQIRSIAKLYASPKHTHQDTIDFRTAQHLLALREYDTAELLLCRGTCSPEAMGKTVRLLCKHGFARLLERILSSENPPPANAFTVNSGYSIEELCGSDPALFVACQRSLPNMEVVRLLVEPVRVDVNARSRTAEERDFIQDNFNHWPDSDEEPDPGLNTARHVFAEGDHWWGNALAIPNLLSKGADVRVPNEAKQSSLQVAERRMGTLYVKETRQAFGIK